MDTHLEFTLVYGVWEGFKHPLLQIVGQLHDSTASLVICNAFSGNSTWIYIWIVSPMTVYFYFIATLFTHLTYIYLLSGYYMSGICPRDVLLSRTLRKVKLSAWWSLSRGNGKLIKKYKWEDRERGRRRGTRMGKGRLRHLTDTHWVVSEWIVENGPEKFKNWCGMNQLS